MAFCPSCRGEYRDEITECATCDGVALVDQLPELRALTPDDDTRAVGLSEDGSRVVEVGGKKIDLSHAYPFGDASEMRRRLEDQGIAAIVLEVPGVSFPGDHGAFEVRVRPEDHAEAEAYLRARWASGGEAEDAAARELDAESCPACGAHVPLDQEECPDCGLVVGAGE